jgi:NAD(P)-dependent dehydrogenase (short-subunit alcohol dehydrogenase family)
MPKAVIITGGGSGIGRCLCRYFALKGWMVCAADLSIEKVHKTVEEISRYNPGAFAVRADIRNLVDVRGMAERCLERFGRIDAIVNNAGITDKKHRTLLDMPYEIWRDIIETNLTGSFMCLRECSMMMIKQGGGNIVNITSLLGQRGYTRIGDTAYGVSKAALEALTEYAASELKDFRINVNSAYPGAMVNTGFFDYLSEEDRRGLESPEIMNELVYVLCSLEPHELTGRSLCAKTWKDDPGLIELYRKYIRVE